MSVGIQMRFVSPGRRTSVFHVHWHRFHHETWTWRYSECRCGQRAADRVRLDLYQPVDREWLSRVKDWYYIGEGPDGT